MKFTAKDRRLAADVCARVASGNGDLELAEAVADVLGLPEILDAGDDPWKWILSTPCAQLVVWSGSPSAHERRKKEEK